MLILILMSLWKQYKIIFTNVNTYTNIIVEQYKVIFTNVNAYTNDIQSHLY